jgi:hypothetical protein
MESIRNSMDPRAKEKHEKEHEDSKKERETRITSHCIKNHKITSKRNQVEELKVVMKNSVWKTYK